ncbi:2-oxoglutarate dehydrogenase E1 component [Macrococcus armenti]|uniref:2-oxoglutarate dehydrogenase E1 component n=1 Tax=Macrococcus armenti TaxID=2875764 RepID=UPI001CCF41A8|nr:2-oxoglutarate dehydrogenase E1 component [Macrococcus armenti]UBH07571.1 2-oxoglutarate dehydrogenase E1 component [Macrococcus armenti]UBH11969.1 2-oxoglutarate dehydrogenase E1 component [Macrococcus armenti]UBH14347.1 2-oxoglutarate dehydrogenase E1 component [Macrococcus armenti]UBH16707.1 2-oxoglutarate dehydrogenase E1 component [Macrococcus armenti]UBH18970.1 2-oxoglutarate dehydrogenase E1 component [Macrococcus armenti]
MTKGKNLEEAPPRFGTNLGILLEMFDEYQKDPSSVSDELQVLFSNIQSGNSNLKGVSNADATVVKNLMRLVDNIRQYGHLKADIYPLYKPKRDQQIKLTLDDFNLTEEVLKQLPASLVSDHYGERLSNAFEAITEMQQTYQGPIAYEVSHINNTEEREWLKTTIESNVKRDFSTEERIELLKSVARVEGFEKYIHKNFVGAKRFSIEGVDALVPMLEQIIKISNENNIPDIEIGMAHRGRLNVLTHILEKPYEMMLSEFMHTDPMKFLPEDGSLVVTKGWTGDVKYHLGGTKITERFGNKQMISLANNPSHLEIVAPVVLGKTRAVQEVTEGVNKPVQDFNKALAILIHGDAAFPGQGINFESMNLSNLDGYSVGGSIHIITNNRVGFTTEPYDSRSTTYATDVAKGYDLPIIHVNADDLEACIEAVELAMQYRQKFNKDFVIDLVGYRRYGHNEMDEPTVTNPMLYKEVKVHPSIELLYGKSLVEASVITEQEMNAIFEEVNEKLRQAHDKIDKSTVNTDSDMRMPQTVATGYDKIDTGVSLERLKTLNDNMLTTPEGFTVFNKLQKILERRNDPFTKDGLVDWGHAELLAYGTIIQDGNPVRHTGQDAERGTFAHRHALLHDVENGAQYVPLQNIEGAKSSFDIHNSPLSEAAVVGFEYGYNLHNNQALAVWEAQYGDFANMAQMIFDNFISSAEAKWGEKSGLTVLLPHAFEGQGPEHSSARLERFLQLAAENNWTVANLTSSANYFHLLRRQAHYLGSDKMRPLIVMSPKSLLRNNFVSDTIDKFTEGGFKAIISDQYKKTKVKKLLIASGKVAVDLMTELSKNPNDEIHVIRLEQIYPFPKEDIKAIIDDIKGLSEIGFVQEEPQNQGSWHYIYPLLNEIKPEKVKLSYYGRPHRAAPAEGDNEIHKIVQSKLISEALNI